MVNYIFDLFKNRELKSIWVFIYDENDANELILNPDCVVFEIGEKFIYILNNYGSMELSVIDNIDILLSEDGFLYKVDVRNWIMDDILNTYYFEKIGFIDAYKNNKIIKSVGIQIDFFTTKSNKFDVFLYVDIQGLRIGGQNRKNNWINNVYKPIHNKEPIIKWLKP
ncbi:MAG: hypothetical protein IJ583_01980 [Firmicutes bacterium]|nr:hypothetical protein [Bacillota bacterium]